MSSKRSNRFLAALPAALVIALAAPHASAIYLNTDAFRAAGGNPDDIVSTAEAGLHAAWQRSFQAPFDAVGRLASECTGTVLGADTEHLWILTAAHCVNPGWNHFGITTPTTGSWAWSQAHHAPNADIAMVSMPLSLVPIATTALTKPLIYDGNAEVGLTVYLAGTGLTGVGTTGVSVPGIERMTGTSTIVGAFDDGTTLLGGYQPEGPSDLQAHAAPGDHGGAGWQQPVRGYWTIIGVTSGVDAHGTHYTRINRHIDWIKRLFPGVSTFNERFTVTDSRPFVSRNHGEDVDHGSVYYVLAPGQANVQGPMSATWLEGASGPSRITVMAKDAVTGTEYPIALRATRSNGCRNDLAMENAVMCRSGFGPLTVAWNAADNPDLPSGQWQAAFDIDAKGSHRNYGERLPIRIDIPHLTQAIVTANASWQSPNYANAASYGSVYYLVPPQTGAWGPSERIWNGERTHSTIRVLAKEATTGFQRHIVLRAQRDSGCGLMRMEDGANCYAVPMGPLTVAYHAADNTDLPAGIWRGVAYIQAKGWHDPAVDEAIRLDVDIAP